jgi:hypothetical protein
LIIYLKNVRIKFINILTLGTIMSFTASNIHNVQAFRNGEQLQPIEGKEQELDEAVRKEIEKILTTELFQKIIKHLTEERLLFSGPNQSVNVKLKITKDSIIILDSQKNELKNYRFLEANRYNSGAQLILPQASASDLISTHKQVMDANENVLSTAAKFLQLQHKSSGSANKDIKYLPAKQLFTQAANKKNVSEQTLGIHQQVLNELEQRRLHPTPLRPLPTPPPPPTSHSFDNRTSAQRIVKSNSGASPPLHKCHKPGETTEESDLEKEKEIRTKNDSDKEVSQFVRNFRAQEAAKNAQEDTLTKNPSILPTSTSRASSDIPRYQRFKYQNPSPKPKPPDFGT